MEAVRVHRALAQQTKVGISGEVAARLGKQRARPGHLSAVFRHMRLNPHLLVLGCQFTGTAQLGRAAGRGKTWRDGVTQALHAVPALQQGLRVDQALLGGIATTVRSGAVEQIGRSM